MNYGELALLYFVLFAVLTANASTVRRYLTSDRHPLLMAVLLRRLHPDSRPLRAICRARHLAPRQFSAARATRAAFPAVFLTADWSSRTASVLIALIVAFVAAVAWRAWRQRGAARRRYHAELASRDERFRMALWGSGDEFWDYNFRTKTVHRIGGDQGFGGKYEDVTTDEVWRGQVIHPDDVAAFVKRRQDYIEGRTDIFESEHRVLDASGKWVWRLSRGKIVEWDADGTPLRASGIARNVTKDRLAERAGRIAAQVLDSMSEAVCVIDLDFHIVSTNKAFAQMTGYDAQEIIDQPVGILHSGRQSADSYRMIREDYVTLGHWHGEMWQRCKDGNEYLAWMEINAVEDRTGTRTQYVCVMTDITDRKRSEQDLRYLANYDILTGLPNRSLLVERLGDAIERARRNDTRVAVLFLDLDRFKHINDSLGHSSGDQTLKAVGERLRASVRDVDTVSRIGGDEFTLVIGDLNDAAQAEAAARRILSELSTPLILDGGRETLVTPSIGISLFPDHANGPMNLLKFADTAMYQAKDHGRNTYIMYTPTMDTTARQWAATAAALRKALENNELSIVFQPKLSLRDNRMCGVEVLLRWTSELLGEISPAHFIPLAEQTGLIVEIGDYVLRSACAQLKRWEAMDLGTSISVAVNVSVMQLLRGELPATLRDILAEYAVDPANLQLELTESVLMARGEQTLTTLDEIKTLGVTLAIDDFGTGYSSLSYLKRLPIDTVKIDRSFIDDLMTDPDDRAITGTIIAMAHALELNVVAEGVETRDQLDYLREHGCDEIQGEWYSPPLTAEACTAFLLDRSSIAVPEAVG